MVKSHHGAPSPRRWGRLLVVGAASCTLAACATPSEGGNPPKHCSRASARNANPYGSIFSQADVSAAPAPAPREGGGAEVMVFGKDAEPAPEALLVPDLTPPPPAPRNGAPAPVNRPLSMGPISQQTELRSC